jgi:hypothetical protein
MSNPTTIKYDWDEALAHLQLLGHQGVGVTKISAFRAKPQEGLRYIGVFEPTKYQLAIEQMRELNRQHPTLSFFVGFNALFESALEFAPNRFVVSSVHPKEPDVITTTNMVLDIDPVSERNESSSEEREAVLTVANNILDTEPLLAEASLIDSGHGAYVLARLPAGDYDWDAVKAFCGELKVRYFSNPAIAGKAELELPGRSKFIGLAGTVNTKWDESIWRPRRLLHQGGVCTTLAEHLHAWQPPVQQGPAEKLEIGNLGPLDERIADWCPADPDLKAFYERLREGEMTQAAFRIRPLKGPHKLIVVLSNLPLQGLPPTELMSMNDLEARLGIKEPPITQRILLTRKRLRAQLGKEPTQDQIAKVVGVGRRFVGKILGSLTIRER